jgi:hypothetical protein
VKAFKVTNNFHSPPPPRPAQYLGIKPQNHSKVKVNTSYLDCTDRELGTNDLEEIGKKLALAQLKVLDRGKPLIHSIRIVGIPAQI